MSLENITIGPIGTCPKCGAGILSCACGAPKKPKLFDFNTLTLPDQNIVAHYLGPMWRMRAPNVVIDSQEKGVYIYRWHIHPRTEAPGQYLHIQTSSDPERPLHDHPWDNMSCILSGGYDEIVQMQPPLGDVEIKQVRAGDTVFRRAEFAHRLILPDGIPYTISLFTMGMRRRMWGFWIDGTWFEYEKCVIHDPVNNHAYFKYPLGTEEAAA